MARAPSFCGLILAAGDSSRMGRDKALLPWSGTNFLGGAIELLSPLTDMVIVIAGRNAENLRPLTDAAAAYLIVNPEPQGGQFSSLRIGVQEVLNRGRDAALVCLVDRPPARPETASLLKHTFLGSAEEVWAVVPEYSGRHGHPVVIGREMIHAFLRAPATANAREVEHQHQQHIRYVTVEDALVVLNVDTPEDYQRITTG